MSAQFKAQASRFVRLFVAALASSTIVSQVATGNLHVDRAAVVAAVVAAAETAFRQVFPVKAAR